MNEPDLSIIIPVYNSGNYVLEAVESILSQDCDVDFEILLINDHSTDPATLDALAKLQNQAPEIRVLDNRGRQGPGAARNVGIRAARGAWIGFLDADDVWPPGSLEARWKVVETTPDANWIAGHYLDWKSNGSLEHPPNFKSPLFEKAGKFGAILELQLTLEDLLRVNMLSCISTNLVRKSLLDKIGCFNESLLYGEDWFLFSRLSMSTNLFFVRYFAAHIRRHHNSWTKQRAAYSVRSHKMFVLVYFDPMFRKYRRQIRWRIMAENRNLSDYHFHAGNKFLSAKYAFLALLWGPNSISQLKIFANRAAKMLSIR